MANSRKKNSLYNFVTSIGAQILTIVLSFVTRTVFINTLGASYLGLNGLFSNILSMLSLAELGVGTAIVFKLYKPLAENDHKRIRILIKFYKQAYSLIALAVTVIGVCLIPFLKYIIKDYDSLQDLNVNVILVYSLYLMSSVFSYLFFAYYTALIQADQKEYILTIVSYGVSLLKTLLQILVLVFLRDFVLYVTVFVGCVILQNLINVLVVKRRYTFLKVKETESISKEEVKSTLKDCFALMLYKLNGVVVKSTDNIVLSSMLGLKYVALYSNYTIFESTIRTVFFKIYNSVGHSIGNLHTINNLEQEYKIFRVMLLISLTIGGGAFILIFCLGSEFINAWIGKQWVLSPVFVFFLGIELFNVSLKNLFARYRNVYGLFQQAKYRPVAGALINIVASVLFVQYWGISGIIAATVLADWTTFMVFDPYILHRDGFKSKYSIKRFYVKVIANMFVVVLTGLAIYKACSMFAIGNSWITLIVHGILAFIVYLGVIVLMNHKTEEFNYLLVATKIKKK